jgi:hypothetical protein
MKNFNKKPIRFFLFLSLMLIVSACNREIGRIFPNRPDTEFTEDLKTASPEFRQGWEDGCEVGMSGGSGTFYKIFYSNNKVDGYKMTGSSDYKNAWGNAFWYCYRYDYVKQSSSIWGSTFGGYK